MVIQFNQFTRNKPLIQGTCQVYTRVFFFLTVETEGPTCQHARLPGRTAVLVGLLYIGSGGA